MQWSGQDYARFDLTRYIHIRPRGTTGYIWGITVQHAAQEMDAQARHSDAVKYFPEFAGYRTSQGWTLRELLRCKYGEDGNLLAEGLDNDFQNHIRNVHGAGQAWLNDLQLGGASREYSFPTVGWGYAGGANEQVEVGDTFVFTNDKTKNCPACKGNSAKRVGAWDAPCA